MLHRVFEPMLYLKKITYILLVVIILNTTIMLVYVYKYYHSVDNQLTVIQKDNDTTISKVGSLISLPSDERPLVSLISDVNSYDGAKPGDKALIYFKSQKIIIFNENNNKIVSINTIKTMK